MPQIGILKHEGKKLLLDGYSPIEIAEMFNASKDTVLTYNKRIWRVPLKKQMCLEDIELAKSMIVKGFTYKQIATQIGFKPSTIADRNIREWRLPYSDIQASKKLVKRNCKTCGKEFCVRKQKLKHDACNYCSKKCSHIGAIKPDKILNPIFRGYRWSYLSSEIREKTPFCQRCLKTNIRLTVHHIRPWRLNGDNNGENLLVLCNSCHRHIEVGSQQLFDIIGVDKAVGLITKIYNKRLEKIKWIYNKSKKLK